MEQSDEDGEREKLVRETEVGELPMDTPERGRLTTPLSKFEDSPVFNYICNLSPLETRRPLQISQSFNSYSFSSVPSIFASPHVSTHKEAKLIRRHSLSGRSNQEFSSENGNKICSVDGSEDIAHKSGEQKESFDPGGCIANSFIKENLENVAPINHIYDCHGLNDSIITSHGNDPKADASSNSLVLFGQERPNSANFNKVEENREEGCVDWVNISEAADFLIFDSPNNAHPFLEPLDSETRLHVSEKTQADILVGVEINETENTQPGTVEDQLNGIEETRDALAFTCFNNEATFVNNQAAEASKEMNVNESGCNLPRGIRRRCLVFDIGAARRNYLNDGSSSSSPTLLKCNKNSTEKKTIISNNSSRCIVPGIGLHLNALARNSKDYSVNNHELINDSIANNQEITNKSPSLNFMDRDVGLNGGFRDTEDQLSGYLGSNDLKQGSPKNKHKVENGGEAESCKRCNCKKSKCLKLYCECFAAGVYCVEPCSCQDCFNKPIHEDKVLETRKLIESRNPLAFAPKVIRTVDFVPETTEDLNSTPASARHKRGCNCKKSGCLKKYCECFQGGVGCSINCRCEACKNTFGRKDGSYSVLGESEFEEPEMHQKSVANRNSSKSIILNNTDHTPESALLETPMHRGRAPISHPFSSKNKPPKSFLSTGSSSSSTLFGGQKFGISSLLQPQMKFEEKMETNLENEEIPEILRSPTTGIKFSSPNNKRVSPPHHEFGSSLSPARKITRKLILHSIPSFPSLKD